MRLQDELAGTENRIAVERRKYNQTVQTFNTYIQLFPNNIVASMSGFAREDAYFRTSEEARQAPPAVNFTRASFPGPGASAKRSAYRRFMNVELGSCTALESVRSAR